MKRRFLIATALLTMTMSGMTAYAAPKTMPDGNVFDAEYYAQNNPDVVAVIGTDENVLYQHYQSFGKAEGRKPYEEFKETSIREQVNALGIYYTPEKDKDFLPSTQYQKSFIERPVDISSTNVVTNWEDIGKPTESSRITDGFQRGDYTNDPFYLALAQEFMKQRTLYYVKGDTEADKYFRVRDYLSTIYLGDMSREYLRDVVGNFCIDYSESIIGGQLKSHGGGTIYDETGEYASVRYGKGVTFARSIAIPYWPSALYKDAYLYNLDISQMYVGK